MPRWIHNAGSWKRFCFALVRLCVVLLLAGGAAPSKDDPTIKMTVRFAKQDGPVRILGLRPPEIPGKEPFVHLQNLSSKKTVHIWVEAIITDGKGKVSRTNSNAPNQFWPEERAIPPGGEVWAREIVLRSSSLGTFLKEMRANCVFATAQVMKVEFEDGSSWDKFLDKKSAGFEVTGESGEQEACAGATATQEEVQQMLGPQVGPPPRATETSSPEEVQYYSFTCSLRPRQGKLVASCPY
ncbi:MAG TPA: hypothetical protein VED66_17215 [Candidatus Sulfotelmatobacter sp.]|nr:hypothetical protein [Candidatus Sulfotelmatobacter sp.]